MAMKSGKGVRIEIVVKERLDAHRADWLEGFEIDYPQTGGSRINGLIPDQSALHGLLALIRDLNLTLLSFKQF